jgi:hypothetical protein
MPLNSAYSAALICLFAWGSLASGQESPKPPGTSDLPPGVRWLRDLESARPSVTVKVETKTRWLTIPDIVSVSPP